MPAWDNVTLPRAPDEASYAAPLVGFQIGDRIADLPSRFYRGAAAPYQLEQEKYKTLEAPYALAEQRRQYELARAFPQGLPTGPNGQIDYAATLQRLAQHGDLGQIAPLSTIDLQRKGMQQSQEIEDRFYGGGGVTAPPAPTPAPPPGPGASLGPTLKSVATKAVGPDGDPTPIISDIARRFRLNPETVLKDDPAMLAEVTRAVKVAVGEGATETNMPAQPTSAADVNANVRPVRYASRNTGTLTDAADVTPQRTGVPFAPMMKPDGSIGGPSAVTDLGHPIVPTGGVSGAPAPAPGAAPETAMPSAGIMPNAPPQALQRLAQTGPGPMPAPTGPAPIPPGPATPVPGGGPPPMVQSLVPPGKTVPETIAFYRRMATSYAWVNPRVASEYQRRADVLEQYVTQANLPTQGQREYWADRLPGESQAAYEARREGLKQRAQAPYEILRNAAREAGHALTVRPNEVVTTGGQVNPPIEAATRWAAEEAGIPIAGGPAGAEPSPGGAAADTGAAGPGGEPGLPMGRSRFIPQLVRNPDGSLSSNVTPGTEEIQKTIAGNYEKAHEAYNGAQAAQQNMLVMYNAAKNMNAAGWSKTGTGSEMRLEMAKAVNTIWQTLGVKDKDLPFDPSKIASWETLTKETTRLGMELARTLGSRESQMVVQSAVKASPGAPNTEQGFRNVWYSIWQVQERAADYFQFATQYAKTHGGDLMGAEIEFAKSNPPSLYTRRALLAAQKDIEPEAIDMLRANPALAPQFDASYKTPGAAKLFLGP